MTIEKSAWLHIQDKKVLFVRTKGKDAFYSPGGKREGDETDEEALVREIDEEVGVQLIPDTVQLAETFTAQAHGKPEGVMVQIKCYWGEFEGELQPTNEIEELAWFTSSDMERTSQTGQLILAWLKEQGYIE